MENGSVPYATEVSDDIQRIEESNSLDTGLTIPEEEVDDLVKLNKESMEPVNAEEIQDQCWSLDNWDLPEYPLQRKEISLKAMIMEIHQKQQNYKLYVLEEITVIQLFEILYVLQVEDTQIGGTQIEDMLKKIASIKSKGNTTKATNLSYALKYVQKLAQERSVSLDVERFIVETHKQIMGPEEEGGVFSTKRRFGRVDNNTRHEYPKFDSEEIARMAVQSVIDHYNLLLDEIILLFNEDSIKALEKLFKLCGMLLFKITYYHPFGDGNGRLARLLISYALSPFTPFPTPVYGLFSPSTRAEYVDALVEGRQPNGNASILTALIIESSYYTWKKFDEVVKMAKIRGNLKELLLSCAEKPGK